MAAFRGSGPTSRASPVIQSYQCFLQVRGYIQYITRTPQRPLASKVAEQLSDHLNLHYQVSSLTFQVSTERERERERAVRTWYNVYDPTAGRGLRHHKCDYYTKSRTSHVAVCHASLKINYLIAGFGFRTFAAAEFRASLVMTQ